MKKGKSFEQDLKKQDKSFQIQGSGSPVSDQ